MSTGWDVAAAVAQRNGLSALTLYAHASAHHEGDPQQPGWMGRCEEAAACLHGLPAAVAGELARAAAEVTDRYLRPALEAAGIDPDRYQAIFDTSPLSGGAP